MSGHTPGPWMVSMPGGTVFGPAHTHYERIIARLPKNGTSTEFEANSDLIAAAPDLLVACKGLLGFIRARFPEDFRDGGRGFTCPHHLAIEAAIAKAEGQ